jgi:hypothetical protein
MSNIVRTNAQVSRRFGQHQAGSGPASPTRRSKSSFCLKSSARSMPSCHVTVEQLCRRHLEPGKATEAHDQVNGRILTRKERCVELDQDGAS